MPYEFKALHLKLLVCLVPHSSGIRLVIWKSVFKLEVEVEGEVEVEVEVEVENPKQKMNFYFCVTSHFRHRESDWQATQSEGKREREKERKKERKREREKEIYREIEESSDKERE